jgi:hypothetical protein
MGQMDPKGDSLVVREVLEGGAAQKQGMLPGTDFVERMRYMFLLQCEDASHTMQDASHTEDASCEMHLVPVLERSIKKIGLSLPKVMYVSDNLYLLYACFGAVFDCILFVSSCFSCSFSALASSRSPFPFALLFTLFTNILSLKINNRRRCHGHRRLRSEQPSGLLFHFDVGVPVCQAPCTTLMYMVALTCLSTYTHMMRYG